MVPKTEDNKKRAREASTRYRNNLREAGIPTGEEISKQIGIAVVQLLAAGRTLTKNDLRLIKGVTCQLAGWDATNERLRTVVNRHVNVMAAKLPVTTELGIRTDPVSK